jgi:hypothetical protein
MYMNHMKQMKGSGEGKEGGASTESERKRKGLYADGSLQTQFGANLQLKRAKNGADVAKPMLP